MRMISLIFTLFTLSAHADLIIEWKDEKGGMTKNYYKDGSFLIDSGEDIIIIDTKAGFSYVVNPSQKTISKTNLKQKLAQANNFIGDTSKIPTQKNKKVNNYDCAISEIKKKSQADVLVGTVCETHYKTLGISSNTYREIVENLEKVMPHTNPFFNKAKGFLSIELTAFSRSAKSSLILNRIEEKILPGSIFQLPKGYKTTNPE